eukprot:CAMPEP_0173200778 /NCGR_PEP_ID=MMETSP1141-20130122/17975_1 /TAXON_ID=483371 /ORGANISM="non described non described, Strain CCMP2298" /LENGTH=444 /DNA_ID=CAMNT_0014125807 /DNA_START=97 /DNA_END=1431 /DNA_ORIENTATION=+
MKVDFEAGGNNIVHDIMHDDIDCRQWLHEINLSQYAETFLVNLSVDGRVIRRKRLNQLRQQDLCSMNITNFSHQKRLMEHVRLVQRYAFHSPQRKSEVKEVIEEPESEYKQMDAGPVSPRGSGKVTKQPSVKARVSSLLNEKKKSARRRRSFDADVWNSISTMRKKALNNVAQAELLREGFFSSESNSIKKEEEEKKVEEKKERRRSVDRSSGERVRRRSFNGATVDQEKANQDREKALMYGNMALEYDMMLSSLEALQTETLNELKSTVSCEVVSLFFVNKASRELLVHTLESKWFRVPFGTGICGNCYETGTKLNIPDAYKDWRFNKNMDTKTGFKTRNVLCQPVRGNRGGGSIVAVIQALNKVGADHFDDHDEEMLSACVAKVADLLSVRFSELMNVAEKFCGQAILVGAKGGGGTDKPGYLEQTAATSSKNHNKSSAGQV